MIRRALYDASMFALAIPLGIVFVALAIPLGIVFGAVSVAWARVRRA